MDARLSSIGGQIFIAANASSGKCYLTIHLGRCRYADDLKLYEVLVL